MAVFPNYVCGSTSGSESSWVVTMFDTGVDELLEAGDARLDEYEGMVPGSLKFWDGRTGGKDYDFTDRFRTDIGEIGVDLASKFNDPYIPTNPTIEVGSQFNRSGYKGGNSMENFAINKVADFSFGLAQDAINQGFRNLLPGQGVMGIGIHDWGLTPDGELAVYTGAWYNWDFCSDNEVTGERKETTLGIWYRREDKSDWFGSDDPAPPTFGGPLGGGSGQAFGGSFELLNAGPNAKVKAKFDAFVQENANQKQTANATFTLSVQF